MHTLIAGVSKVIVDKVESNSIIAFKTATDRKINMIRYIKMCSKTVQQLEIT